jgi:hypothetical protein
MDVANVADAAASRSTNKNPVDLASHIILGGTLPAAIGTAMYGHPLAAAGEIIGGVAQYGINRAVRQGAGPRKLINLGKRLQKTSEPPKSIGNMTTSIRKTVGNQKGEMDLGEKSYGLVPAIKSPESGKIYTGSNMTGHKGIFNQKISKQEPHAERTVWNELFKDNTGEYSPYIGFVDKQGNFISRAEAEKMLSSPKTLAMQFHNASGAVKGLAPLAGVSTAALGGLTAAEYYKRKKQIGNMRSK